MPKRPKKVSTIGQFVDWVEEIGGQFTKSKEYESPWFRGTGNSGYALLPGLYRTKEGRKWNADDELRNEFSRKALPLVADIAPRNDWDWYFLMQHYRAPTRLLDWTDSALIALYFGLTSWAPPSSKKARQAKPSVWALNPFKLNQGAPVGTDWEAAKPYLPPVYARHKIPAHPIAIDPTFTAQRMLVQRSHFTLHGSDFRSLNDMQQELGLEEDLVQVVIEVDQDGLDYLKWHLTLLGITETTLFPDLEGLARELRQEYGLDRTRPDAD